MTLRIYLAGPDVFLRNAREVGNRKREVCQAFGFEGLFPLDKDVSVGQDAAAIFQANCSRMRRADIGLFNLTPFRGPSADVGTIFELGFMFALGKPLFGYANASGVYRERVDALLGPVARQSGHLWDRDGYEVEDFGLRDNLMVVRGILESGGTIAVVDEKARREKTEEQGKDDDAGEPLAAFRAFKVCLQGVREWMEAKAANAVEQFEKEA
jgi:nucleoside 2-deoxyribosyltransferase